jgi:mono/diheme cytochrome c family protein
MPTPHRHARLLVVLVALAALVAAASGCGTTKTDEDRGRMLFRSKCGTCHALAQAGTSGQVGPNLDDAFAAARAAGQTSGTIEGVVTSQVENPRPSTGNPAVSMPPDIVTGQDLEDVAAYVGTWAGVPGAEPPKVPGGPGAQVFASTGCGTCHTLAAAESGGTTGPNLDEFLAPADDEAAIKEMIVDPNAEVVKGYPAGVMPPNYGDMLTPKELNDLIAYLIENTPAGGGKGKSGGKSKTG